MSTYEGFGCTATLDIEEGTVTLVHAGVTAPKHKKASSPRVIPLGAIEDVEYVPKTLLKRGYIRLLLRGRAGYDPIEIEDVNTFLLKGKGADQFVEAVRKAASSASPVEGFGAPGTDSAHALSVRERMQAANDRLGALVEANDRERELSKTHNFASFGVRENGIWHDGTQYELAGVHARIDEPEPGTAVLAVLFPNGAVLTHPLKPKQVEDASRFAELVNELALSREQAGAQ